MRLFLHVSKRFYFSKISRYFAFYMFYMFYIAILQRLTEFYTTFYFSTSSTKSAFFIITLQ